MNKITIQHNDRNGREYGYGLYINAVGNDGIIYASECLNKKASDNQIKAAERRVRSRGYRELSKIDN